MKFLFLCQSSPLKTGGAETRNREVARRLRALGHEVTILCGKTTPGDPEEIRWEGVRILQKKVLPDFLLRRYPFPHYLPLAAANLVLAFHLLRLLGKERFDVLREDVSPFPPSGLLSLIRLRNLRRSAVLHNLSCDFRDWVKYYGLIFGACGYVMSLLLRNGLLRFDVLICSGKWFAEELQAHPAIARRVGFVPNGFSSEFFQAPSLRRENGSRLLAVGRLVETKGHRFLIEAVGHLASQLPEIRLSLYGDGPLRSRLAKQCARLGISDVVKIESSRPPSEMPEVYRAHDLLVMPSLFEGMPMVALEAMAGGLPVVVSDTPAFRSLFDEKSAIFFQPANSRDLADKLLRALRYPEMLATRAAAAQEKARDCPWERVTAWELEKMAP